MFRHVLNFLRLGKLYLPAEFKYVNYCLMHIISGIAKEQFYLRIELEVVSAPNGCLSQPCSVENKPLIISSPTFYFL